MKKICFNRLLDFFLVFIYYSNYFILAGSFLSLLLILGFEDTVFFLLADGLAVSLTDFSLLTPLTS